MSQKKKKNQPTEIHWNILEKQLGIDLSELEETSNAQSKPKQNTRNIALFRKQYDFDDAEVKANSLGLLSKKQSLKLLLYTVFGGGGFLILALAFLFPTFVFMIAPFNDVEFLLMLSIPTLIGLSFLFLSWNTVEYPVSVKSEDGYFRPFVYSKNNYRLVISYNPVYSSSNAVKLRIDRDLFMACRDDKNKYRVFYNAKTKRILSVELIEHNLS